MTYQEVAEMIAEIGVPSAYYQFPEGTGKGPPYVCFFYPNDDDLHADNHNYVRIRQLVIELYTDEKDLGLEATVEGVLTSHDLAYSYAEEFLDSEQMHETIYTTEVIINAYS